MKASGWSPKAPGFSAESGLGLKADMLACTLAEPADRTCPQAENVCTFGELGERPCNVTDTAQRTTLWAEPSASVCTSAQPTERNGTVIAADRENSQDRPTSPDRTNDGRAEPAEGRHFLIKAIEPAERTDALLEPTERPHALIKPTARTQELIEPAGITDPLLEPAERPHALIEPAGRTHALIEPAERTHALIEPAEIPHALIEPAERPHALIEPAERPHALIEPAERTHALIEPAEIPHALIEPAERPHALIEPAERPHALLEPAERPHALIEPAERPHALIEPAERPQALIEPSERTHALLEPAGITDPLLEPAERPHTLFEPVERPQALIEPSERPQALIEPSERPHALTETTERTPSVTEPPARTCVSAEPAEGTLALIKPAERTPTLTEPAAITCTLTEPPDEENSTLDELSESTHALVEPSERGSISSGGGAPPMPTKSLLSVPSGRGSPLSRQRTRLYSIASIFDEEKWAIKEFVDHKAKEKYKQMAKMLVVVLVPVITLIGVTGTLLRYSVVHKSHIQHASSCVGCATDIGELVGRLQEERRRTALYLSSRDQTPQVVFVDMLEARDLTDSVSESQILDCLPDDALIPSSNSAAARSPGMVVGLLSEFRDRVDIEGRAVPLEDCVSVYNGIIDSLLHWATVMLDIPHMASALWHKAVAKNALLRLTDHLDVQQSLGAAFYTNCNMSDVNQAQFENLEGQIKAHTAIVFDYQPECMVLFERLLQTNLGLADGLQAMKDGIMGGASYRTHCSQMTQEDRLTSSETWSEYVTRYKDILTRIGTQLTSQIDSNFSSMLGAARRDITIYSIITAVISVACVSLSLWYATCIHSLTKQISIYALKTSEKSRELAVEKKRTDTLLYQMLPMTVADQLKEHQEVTAEYFDSVTIFFSDIVGFTSLSSVSTPYQVVDLLNALYSMFDSTLEKYDVYKVETIGDAYMVVSGLPQKNEHHAVEIALMAVDIRQKITEFVIPHIPSRRLQIRIGIHTGACVSGVVGSKMPRYCLFGDTVNVASRMESTSEAQMIQISQATRDVLVDTDGFSISPRGEVDIKGKGMLTTYWLQDVNVDFLKQWRRAGPSVAYDFEDDNFSDPGEHRTNQQEVLITIDEVGTETNL